MESKYTGKFAVRCADNNNGGADRLTEQPKSESSNARNPEKDNLILGKYIPEYRPVSIANL